MDARRYLNTNYPRGIRENVRNLTLRCLAGANINLNGFDNLEKVAFFNSNFANLNISNLRNLKEVLLAYNNAASISIVNCPNLENVYLVDNSFASINIQNQHRSFMEVPTNCI
ncbi:6117_t:CDS:1 [Gigaspora margarita]|uniref:6117_t:CDS:1 n=1 Tax=Gigaspora margarita TaxID=4874 RepID=A0ABN7UAQ8_GIGMA|nr:6117_t:CDS:1 [Gigaspora margarita]